MDKRRYKNFYIEGKNVIEVKEDELGIPVTARRNVTIPPRMGGVFHVDVNTTFDTKGDVVAFTRPESDAVQYMDVLGPGHEIKQNLHFKPRNWIPKSANVTLIEVNKTFTCMDNTINGEDSLLTLIDLHIRRRTIKENSENSLKSQKTDVKEEEIPESVVNAETENTPKQCENKEDLCES